MKRQDDFNTLYQRYRVEDQLMWYRTQARIVRTRHRILLGISSALLILIAAVNILAAAELVSLNLWVAFGIVVPVTALTLVGLVGYSSPGRQSQLYLDVARELEAARTEGEVLRVNGPAGEAEIARWVERVERILQAAEGQAGQVSGVPPGWEARPPSARER